MDSAYSFPTDELTFLKHTLSTCSTDWLGLLNEMQSLRQEHGPQHTVARSDQEKKKNHMKVSKMTQEASFSPWVFRGLVVLAVIRVLLGLSSKAPAENNKEKCRKYLMRPRWSTNPRAKKM